ncbi:MAG: hypothetical protein M3Q99_03090 [Acidobacteriota bacterium]|nr:hypothetical protein [Acidobacteriota bacterium]
MTKNQEKEVFLLLNTIVTQVQSVQSDVKEIKQTVNEHSQILSEHSQILSEHSQTLHLLVSKVDSIAETVMTNDRRLTAVEKNVDDLRGEIH